MSPFSRANWIALTGLAVTTAGVILYTQLGEIAAPENWAVVSLVAMLGGLLTALVGSVLRGRRASLGRRFGSRSRLESQFTFLRWRGA